MTRVHLTLIDLKITINDRTGEDDIESPAMCQAIFAAARLLVKRDREGKATIPVTQRVRRMAEGF